MFKKYVLAFLLLFFSSVSFADFEYYPTKEAALSVCESEVAIFNKNLSPYTYNYQGITGTQYPYYLCQLSTQGWAGTPSFRYVYLLRLRTPFLEPEYTKISEYTTCLSPYNVITPEPSDLFNQHFLNSCSKAPPINRWYSDKTSAVDACTSDFNASFKATAAYTCLSVDKTSTKPANTGLTLNVYNSVPVKNYSVCESPKLVDASPADGFENSCKLPDKPNYKKWVKSKALAANLCQADSFDPKFLALVKGSDFLMCPESSTDVKLKKGVVTKVLLRVCRVPRAWFTSQGGSKRRPI